MAHVDEGKVLLSGVLVLVLIALGLLALGVVWSLTTNRKRAPRGIQWLAVGGLAFAFFVGAWTANTLSSHSTTSAFLFVALVAVPVAPVVYRARATRSVPWLGATASAAFAWPGPFLASVVVLFALSIATPLDTPVPGIVALAVAVLVALPLGSYVTDRVTTPATN